VQITLNLNAKKSIAPKGFSQDWPLFGASVVYSSDGFMSCKLVLLIAENLNDCLHGLE
jgi:hypothetical protein